ncbi:FUSC family protein [Mesonia sediminis]|uniref:FUSC family protein n=1 Tax=Mesonia sediminis TaxID=1703946 RepID=A0ABW5SEU7_9FLAO
MFKRFKNIINDTDFIKAWLLLFSLFVPVFSFYLVDAMPYGIAMALGVFLIAPSDVQGNLKHRFYGMVSAAILAVLGSLLGEVTQFNLTLNLICLFLFVFFTASVAVYGFRASLVSFSGLLAIVLSYANFSKETGLGMHLLFLGLGCCWYILVSTLYIFIRPHSYIKRQLGNLANTTAQFLVLRQKIVEKPKNLTKYLEKQNQLHIQINELHESLRESLISNRKIYGQSNTNRRNLLIFTELIDIFEVALANPIDYNWLTDFKKTTPQIIKRFSKLQADLAKRLFHFSSYFLSEVKLEKKDGIRLKISKLRDVLQSDSSLKSDIESKATLKTWFNQEVSIYEKLSHIERIVLNLKSKDKLAKMSSKSINRFLTPVDYSFKAYKNQLSFKNIILRHALRLAVLMVVGVVIGKLFALQNAYWIVLTALVILRPNFGLTKERSIKRILGTLLGGAIAFLIVFLFQDPILFLVLSMLCLVVAFTLIQKNYIGAAAFITLNVVFLYALLQPNVLSVIQYRLLDTVIGATLAFCGNFFLWPTWEHANYQKEVKEAIKGSLAYFNQIRILYSTKKKVDDEYKLARKSAFLAQGNLSAALQRMAQEPKSKQDAYQKLYKYSALNQTFISSLASLGNFINTHKTTQMSDSFAFIAASVSDNLNITLANLEGKSTVLPGGEETKSLKNAYNDLSYSLNKLTLTQDETEKIQEAILIFEQIKWLYEISEKLKKIS